MRCLYSGRLILEYTQCLYELTLLFNLCSFPNTCTLCKQTVYRKSFTQCGFDHYFAPIYLSQNQKWNLNTETVKWKDLYFFFFLMPSFWLKNTDAKYWWYLHYKRRCSHMHSQIIASPTRTSAHAEVLEFMTDLVTWLCILTIPTLRPKLAINSLIWNIWIPIGLATLAIGDPAHVLTVARSSSRLQIDCIEAVSKQPSFLPVLYNGKNDCWKMYSQDFF